MDCRCTAQQSTAYDGVCVNIVFGRKSEVNRLFAVYFPSIVMSLSSSPLTQTVPSGFIKSKISDFAFKNTVPASKKFQMALTDICHHADIRLYHLA